MAASEIAKKAESDDVKVGDLIAPKTEENTEEAAE